MEKIKIDMPVIVEGKYDKIKLESVIDAPIITCNGFRIFKSNEKRALLRALSEKSKLIILADSDHAGMLIRSHISGIIKKDRLINLYTPQIEGKERRKDKPSKEGFVGVEGVDVEILRRIFEPFASGYTDTERRKIAKTDLYSLGLSGCDNAAERRAAVCAELGLPRDISANAMLEAVNLLVSFDEFEAIAKKH